MSFFAQRGSRVLTEDEFRAHLALVVRLENVGILLGAGASKSAGGGSMVDVWKSFREQSPASVTWLAQNGFTALDVGPDSPNIEEVIDRLEIAILDVNRRNDKEELGALLRHRSALLRSVLRAALLQTTLWRSPEMLSDNPALDDHIRLLARLVSNRQPGQPAPWVFTTNYDLSVEWAAEALSLNVINGFAGTHLRTFVPSNFDLGFRNVQSRGEARFGTYNIYLGKVHGSLSWRMLSDESVTEVPARYCWPDIETYLAGDNGSQHWPGVLIFPGAAKFVQTTGFIYGEIIRRLTEFLSRSNCGIVVSGYGFSDEHLNRVLLSALQNPTLQIIIYLPELNRSGLVESLPSGGESPVKLSPLLQRLIKRQLPQVTICGYGERAHFGALTRDLPEPALLDDPSERARNIMRLMTGLATTRSAAPREEG